MHTIIKGIVEGETRVLAASLTMKQIFEGTKHFKTEVGGGERDGHACHVLHATSTLTCRSLGHVGNSLLSPHPSFLPQVFDKVQLELDQVSEGNGRTDYRAASVPLPQPLIIHLLWFIPPKHHI